MIETSTITSGYDVITLKFTSKERDSESGLGYFESRYHTQADDNGKCVSGCGGYGFASANANWLQSQLT